MTFGSVPTGMDAVTAMVSGSTISSEFGYVGSFPPRSRRVAGERNRRSGVWPQSAAVSAGCRSKVGNRRRRHRRRRWRRCRQRRHRPLRRRQHRPMRRQRQSRRRGHHPPAAASTAQCAARTSTATAAATRTSAHPLPRVAAGGAALGKIASAAVSSRSHPARPETPPLPPSAEAPARPPEPPAPAPPGPFEPPPAPVPPGRDELHATNRQANIATVKRGIAARQPPLMAPSYRGADRTRSHAADQAHASIELPASLRQRATRVRLAFHASLPRCTQVRRGCRMCSAPGWP